MRCVGLSYMGFEYDTYIIVRKGGELGELALKDVGVLKLGVKLS